MQKATKDGAGDRKQGIIKACILLGAGVYLFFFLFFLSMQKSAQDTQIACANMKCTQRKDKTSI